MIRYEKLGYVELNVTDVARARRFYEEMVGLSYGGEGGDGGVWLKCSDDPYGIVLHRAEAPGCKRVGWMLEDDSQFETLYRRLKTAGVPAEEVGAAECRDRALGRICRMVEPNTGATFEFYRPGEVPSAPFAPTLAKIQRLGHAVFDTSNFEGAVAFCRDVLNFRESDAIGDTVQFMRPFPNPYHHGLGIFRSTRNSFNHVNFMVTEVDDVGRGFNRFRRNDVVVVNGPGRHVPSGSVFLYFLDPDGLTLEYSFGMEEFPEVDARAPRRLPALPEIYDSWGAVRDPRMSAIGAIEAYEVAG
jgi:2,3-dihydroxy-p-cumate/2,3-dihydroxybenzoate 3,4-dioxygenase